jgi:iron(III) transport system substrate-binding protein
MDEAVQGNVRQPGALIAGRRALRSPPASRSFAVRGALPLELNDAMKFGKALIALAGLLASYSAAWAQTPTTADVAGYTGADRTERLIAGAKREGAVTVYTSAAVTDMAPVAAAFEKKYGVRVKVWRASSESIVQRSVIEARGGRFDADVFETGGAALEALHREQLLQRLDPPAGADLNPAALTAHREWTGTRFNVFVAAYNTGIVRRDELPKSYDDLLDPRWKGRLGIEGEDSDWFGAVINGLGGERGLKLFRGIVAANGISVRKGHTLLANLVVSGEVPLALTIYTFRADQLKKSGAPLDWTAIAPTIARFEGAAVARRAAHPNAAVLFFEFLLTDAQELLRGRDMFTARRTGQGLPAGLSLTFIDAARSLDESRKWSKNYRDIVITKAR